MPIDTDSEAWTTGSSIDYVEIEISNHLRQNRGKAYTVTELTEHLTEETPHVFPDKLLSGGEQAKWARLAVVQSQLENMVWYNRADVKIVDQDETEAGHELYYTYSSKGDFPTAELEDTVPRRFKKLERKIESETGNLEDRLSNLEYRVREEIGYI